mgnify:CR=1 FL=1
MRRQAVGHWRWIFQGISAEDRHRRLHADLLAAHEPFTSMEDTVLNETCIHSHIVMEQNVVKRKTVNDTDTGKVLRENIAELEELLQAYRSGMLVEKFWKTE